jgi:hypothetical protein
MYRACYSWLCAVRLAVAVGVGAAPPAPSSQAAPAGYNCRQLQLASSLRPSRRGGETGRGLLAGGGGRTARMARWQLRCSFCRPMCCRRGCCSCHILPLWLGVLLTGLFVFSILGLRKMLLPLIQPILPAEMLGTQLGDLQLSQKLAGSLPADLGGPVERPPTDGVSIAFLFLARDSLQNLELWRRFFESRRGADRAKYTLYFHFSDGNTEEHRRKQAETLAAFGRSDVVVVDTAQTRWCELMAAETALYARESSPLGPCPAL